MKKKSEFVHYVEPNYTNYSQNEKLVTTNDGKSIHTNQIELYEKAPSLEDFCIVVDLQVEIPHKQIGKSVVGDKTYCFTWISKPEDGKDSASFFEGKTVKNSNSTERSYLSTSPYDINTLTDVANNGTNECFGINSITIEYNNYMIPEINIEFTDIRGISLFAPEELKHDNISDDIAGSFFKCFFTFPYPRFKLLIKGFYGDPTIYDLCCSDFRAKFNCNN